MANPYMPPDAQQAPSGNPYMPPQSGNRYLPPAQVAPAATKPADTGPMSWLHSLANSPVGHAVGSAASNVSDVLGRPAAAMSAFTTHTPTGNPLTDLVGASQAAGSMLNGSATPEARQSATDAMTHVMTQNTPLEHAAPWVQNLVAQTAIDPTNLLGPAIGKGIGTLGKAAYVGAIQNAPKAAGAVVRAAQAVSPDVGAAVNTGMGNVAKIAAAAHDSVIPGGSQAGATQRALVGANGAQGLTQMNQLKAAKNVGKSTSTSLGNALVDQYNGAVKGLSSSDKGALYDALNAGDISGLSPELQQSAQTIKNTTDTLAHLSGTHGLQDFLTNGTPGVDAIKPDLFRYQKTAGAPEVSPNGGTFYSRHAPDQRYSPKGVFGSGIMGDPIGGPNLVSQTMNPDANILKSIGGPVMPSLAAVNLLREGKPTLQNIATMADPKNVARYLKAVGIPDAQAADIIANHPEQFTDLFGGQLAKNAGYDGISTSGEFMGLTPKATLNPGAAVPGKGGGFTLPDWAQQFAADSPRGLQKASQYREAYVPHAYDPSKFGNMAEMDAAHGLTLTPEQSGLADILNSSDLLAKKAGVDPSIAYKAVVNQKDPFLNPRSVDAKLADPEFQDALFQSRLRAGAKAVAGVDTGKQVASDFGVKGFGSVPKPAQNYFNETFTPQSAKNGMQLGADAVKSVADAPKYGLFFNPLRHMANIGSLSTMMDPGTAAMASGRFALANPEFAGGAIGTGAGAYAAQESGQNPYLGALAGLATGVAGGAALGRTPLKGLAEASQGRAIGNAVKGGAVTVNPDAEIPGLINAIPGLKQLYEGSGKMLWGFDDAQKAAQYQRLVDSGMTYADASAKVGQHLIDYGNKSDLTKAASYAAPFATYRTKLPGAVGASLLDNPQNAAIANRIAPTLTGDRQQDGNGGEVTNYLPLAEMIRGAQDPKSYLRSTLSYPYKDALSMALPPIAGDKGRYFTYGHPVFKDTEDANGNVRKAMLLSQLLSGLPGGEQALSATGANPFPDRDFLRSLLEGSSGFNYKAQQ